MKTKQLTALCMISLLGILPITAAAQPYTVSTDGQEVTDSATGLIWQRCPVGMTFGFAASAVAQECTGTATLYNHERALVYANTASTSAKSWRLPSIRELSGIVDRSRSNPAIDPLFTTLPLGGFWSSSPYAGDPALGWLVDFGGGSVAGGYRSNTLSVRLVRAGQ